MTNTTDMIIQFFKLYGWQLTILATSGIVLLGILKSFGTFNKVKKEFKKYLFYAISCTFSILACTSYILLMHSFEWRAYLILIAGIIGYTSAIYTLYENTGIRDLLKKILFEPTKKLLAKISSAIIKGSLKEEDVIELASSYGVDVANQIIETAKEKAVEEKAKEEAKQLEEKQAETPVQAMPNNPFLMNKSTGRAGMKEIGQVKRK